MDLCVSTWNYQKTLGKGARLAVALDEIRGQGLGAELWLDWTAEAEAFREEEWERLGEICRLFPCLSAHSGHIHDCDPAALCREIDLCRFLGADPLVVHPRSLGFDVGSWDPVWGKTIGEEDRRRIGGVLEHGAEASVRLALENGPPDLLERVLEAFHSHPGAAFLGVCIDTGHANLHRRRWDSPAVRFVERFRDHLFHLHLADNLGEADDHLVPGEGSIEWPLVWKALKRDGYAGKGVFELAVPVPREGAEKSVRFLQALESATA